MMLWLYLKNMVKNFIKFFLYIKSFISIYKHHMKIMKNKNSELISLSKIKAYQTLVP